MQNDWLCVPNGSCLYLNGRANSISPTMLSRQVYVPTIHLVYNIFLCVQPYSCRATYVLVATCQLRGKMCEFQYEQAFNRTALVQPYFYVEKVGTVFLQNKGKENEE